MAFSDRDLQIAGNELNDRLRLIYIEIFQRFDRDEDSALSMEELQELAEACGSMEPEKERLRLLAEYEVDDNGNITLYGFLAAMQERTDADAGATLRTLSNLGYTEDEMMQPVPIKPLRLAIRYKRPMMALEYTLEGAAMEDVTFVHEVQLPAGASAEDLLTVLRSDSAHSDYFHDGLINTDQLTRLSEQLVENAIPEEDTEAAEDDDDSFAREEEVAAGGGGGSGAGPLGSLAPVSGSAGLSPTSRSPKAKLEPLSSSFGSDSGLRLDPLGAGGAGSAASARSADPLGDGYGLSRTMGRGIGGLDSLSKPLGGSRSLGASALGGGDDDGFEKVPAAAADEFEPVEESVDGFDDDFDDFEDDEDFGVIETAMDDDDDDYNDAW